MKLSEFFSAAPHARQVSPRTVTITAVASGKFLPDGSLTPPGRTVAAAVTGCFVFLTGEDYLKARQDAHRSVAAMCAPKEGELPVPADENTFFLELAIQMLWRALREWDESTKTAGDLLFPSADVMRKMVLPSEVDRCLHLYNEFVADEHPSL